MLHVVIETDRLTRSEVTDLLQKVVHAVDDGYMRASIPRPGTEDEVVGHWALYDDPTLTPLIGNGDEDWPGVTDEEFGPHNPEGGDEPAPEDGLISDCQGGYEIFLGGKQLRNPLTASLIWHDRMAAEKFLKDQMTLEKFWPDAWYVNDHGNSVRIENLGE